MGLVFQDVYHLLLQSLKVESLFAETHAGNPQIFFIPIESVGKNAKHLYKLSLNQLQTFVLIHAIQQICISIKTDPA